MRSYVQYFLKLFFFLLLLFISQRIIFLLFEANALKGISLSEILESFVHGFAMDVSAACYVSVLVFLLLCIRLFVRRKSGVGSSEFGDGGPKSESSSVKVFDKILRQYIHVIIVLTGFINTCDIALYQSWGTRINHKAISYLSYPTEAASSALSIHFLFVFVVFILSCFLFIRLYKKIFRAGFAGDTRIYSRIIFIVVVPVILVIGIRGGVQVFPLDKSRAYFSRHAVLNQSALNSSWNFVRALAEPVELATNPYNFFTIEKAHELLGELKSTGRDSSFNVIKDNRPNIILIMLESVSADVIDTLGGRKGIMPEFAELSKEGLLFTRFYTPGFRTEQGLASLVSGFPSQPTTSVIRQFGKFDKLPSLARTLDSAGYLSSYYYAGDLHFAFTGSYLAAMGFDKIYSQENFIFKRRTYWGGYDEELFDFFNKDMKESKQPFFSIIMTSTNHEPFDADVEKIVPGKAGDWCNDYLNTVHYTDQCLGKLIAGMKQQSWYGHTLIAIVADHAHSCPEKPEYNSAQRHRIPFLLLGGALKEEFKGKTNDRLSSQVDVPATFLSMLGLNHDHFQWSKNIFSSGSPEFVFYSFDDGFGWIDPQNNLVYDHKLKQVIAMTPDSTVNPSYRNVLDHGKAYLQLLMEEYMGLSEK